MAPPSLRPFVVTVSVIGLAIIAVIRDRPRRRRSSSRPTGCWRCLPLAILVAELFPVEIPDGDGEVSFSTTFAFALLLTDGVAAVVLVHALALAIADPLRRRPLERLVFNVAQYAICWAIAGGAAGRADRRPSRRGGLQYLELARRPCARRHGGGVPGDSTPCWPARRRRCAAVRVRCG